MGRPSWQSKLPFLLLVVLILLGVFFFLRWKEEMECRREIAERGLQVVETHPCLGKHAQGKIEAIR